MKFAIQTKSEDGFSLMELIVSVLILLPIMGAAVSLFSVGTNQQASEQSSIDANQEARSGLEMMASEIAQAGSHGDRSTVTTAAISTPSATPRAVSVASTAGMTVGDWVDVDIGANLESVKLTAVSSTSITGAFRVAHVSGVPIRLFALPFVTGIIPPTGMAASSSSTGTTLEFFGDICSDSNLYYVEYVYSSTNAQITRSITPITQAGKNPALPFVRNVVPNSVQFTVNTDALGVVTSVNIAMTVRNNWSTASKYQETQLSTRVLIPSALAGSVLKSELLGFGGVNKLPPTPSRVTGWII
jgi:Tfp pilus assembly protein PilW